MAVNLRPIKLGVVGYGMGGRYFHTPFIEAAEGVELAGVVTRSPQRRDEVAADWPGVPVFDSLDALLASGVDAVTITTPPETRCGPSAARRCTVEVDARATTPALRASSR